jgi:heme o synthase
LEALSSPPIFIYAIINLWGIIFHMSSLISTTNLLIDHYWPLIKSRQTFLLTLAGAAGYLCQPPSPTDWLRFTGLAGSLLVTISGCTVLNMLFDRDIDRKMVRTNQRPLALGQVKILTAAYLGAILIAVGLLWAAVLSTLYVVVGLAGVSLNVLVYTLWLKRRSAWSILWGGIAGGMPILAGRVLAIGRIDPIGLLLMLVIVCWIPSHNLTLGMLYSTDYLNAGVPTFLNVFGVSATRFTVTLSSLLTAALMMSVCALLSLPVLIISFLIVASIGLVGLALFYWAKPSQKLIQVLYKYSSLYMLVSMLLLALNGMV